MPSPWTPRHPRTDVHDVLHDGVPPWMREPLEHWIYMRLTFSYEFTIGRGTREDMIRQFDLAARWPRPLRTRLTANSDVRTTIVNLSENEKLEIADWLAFICNEASDLAPLRELQTILDDGGSLWKIGRRSGHCALERRVEQGVQDAADKIMNSTGSAGTLLAEAWAAAFGRAPDPEEAYEKAIKAVEEAGSSVVAPKNAKATLGTMIADMTNQGNWKLPLGGTESNVAVIMARALWTGQGSRHGGNGYRKPGQDEAEAAVLLAIPLVQWFIGATLQRRP